MRAAAAAAAAACAPRRLSARTAAVVHVALDHRHASSVEALAAQIDAVRCALRVRAIFGIGVGFGADVLLRFAAAPATRHAARGVLLVSPSSPSSARYATALRRRRRVACADARARVRSWLEFAVGAAYYMAPLLLQGVAQYALGERYALRDAEHAARAFARPPEWCPLVRSLRACAAAIDGWLAALRQVLLIHTPPLRRQWHAPTMAR